MFICRNGARFAEVQGAKLKAKLEMLGSWDGNAYPSIEMAFTQGLTDEEQRERRHAVRKKQPEE